MSSAGYILRNPEGQITLFPITRFLWRRKWGKQAK